MKIPCRYGGGVFQFRIIILFSSANSECITKLYECQEENIEEGDDKIGKEPKIMLDKRLIIGKLY